MTEPNKGKGFSGLDSMVSDIDVSSIPIEDPIAPPHVPASTVTESPSEPTRPTVYSGPSARPKGFGNGWWWVGGIVVLIIIFNSGDKSSSSSNSYSDSSTINPSPSYTPPPSYTPVPEPAVEQMPPIGAGMVLSDNQIRYCLSEDIRVQAMQGVVNNYSETSVAAFNSNVNDYNSRCSNFKYHSGALERVRVEVETRRAILHSEGLSRALSNP